MLVISCPLVICLIKTLQRIQWKKILVKEKGMYGNYFISLKLYPTIFSCFGGSNFSFKTLKFTWKVFWIYAKN